MEQSERAAWQHKLDNVRGEHAAMLDRLRYLIESGMVAMADGKTDITYERLDEALKIIRNSVGD